MIHDIYTPYLLDTLHEMGTKEIDDPDKSALSLTIACLRCRQK